MKKTITTYTVLILLFFSSCVSSYYKPHLYNIREVAVRNLNNIFNR